MTMKIENYETWKSDISSDTFTFPYNPRTFDDQLNKQVSQNDYPYSFSYFGMTSPFKSRRKININGHFSGSNKLSQFRTFSKHVNSNKLKKLYFTSSKFMIVVPNQVKRTHQAGRTNFVDYVASFTSLFGVLFSDTQKSGGADSSTISNDGNTITPVEKIEGDVSSGNTVTVTDKDGNGFQFTASATETVNIYLVRMDKLGTGNFYTQYYYAEIGGTEQTLTTANSDKSLYLQLEPGDDLGQFSKSNITNLAIKFRDAYTSD